MSELDNIMKAFQDFDIDVGDTATSELLGVHGQYSRSNMSGGQLFGLDERTSTMIFRIAVSILLLIILIKLFAPDFEIPFIGNIQLPNFLPSLKCGPKEPENEE